MEPEVQQRQHNDFSLELENAVVSWGVLMSTTSLTLMATFAVWLTFHHDMVAVSAYRM